MLPTTSFSTESAQSGRCRYLRASTPALCSGLTGTVFSHNQQPQNVPAAPLSMQRHLRDSRFWQPESRSRKR